MTTTSRALLSLTLAFAWGLITASAPAQSDEDLFAQLTSGTDAGGQEESSSVLRQLTENLGGNLRLRGGTFVDGVEYTAGGQENYNTVNSDKGFGSLRLILETEAAFTDWDVGVEAWLETGHNGDWRGATELIPDDENARRHLELNQVYAMHHGNGYELTLGKASLPNGLGVLFSPADQFDTFDWNDPTERRRLGVWQARVDWSVAVVEFTGALLPFPTHPKLPAEDSRWYRNDVEFWFRDEPWLELFLTEDLLAQSPEFLWSRTMDLIDFGMKATEGASPSLILRNQLFQGDQFQDVLDIAEQFETGGLTPAQREALLQTARNTMAAGLQPLLYGVMLAQEYAGAFVLSPAETALLRSMLGVDLNDTFWTMAKDAKGVLDIRRQDADDWDDTGLFLRGRTVLDGWDLFASLYYGHSAYPVLYFNVNELYLEERLPKVLALACGFSTTLGEYEVHAEQKTSWAMENEDDSYVSYVVGSTRSFANSVTEDFRLERVDVTLEYAGEWLFDHQDARGFIADSSQFRIGQNDLIGRVGLVISDRFGMELMGAHELDHGSSLLRTAFTARSGDWETTLAYENFEGDYATHYGYWNNCDRVLLEVTRAF
jgi:hypothetical protein